MQKRQVLINAIVSVTQIIAISIILFVLYKFLLKTIGVEQLGIWSLVFATTSVTQIANLGLTGSVVKFVAKYVARKEENNVSTIIQTACLSIAFFVGIMIVIGFPIVAWLLKFIIPHDSISVARSILPYAFLSLWLTMITGIFQAGLDGYQRIDIRSYILICGVSIHLLLCFILAPKYGLVGVAVASVIQNLSVLVSSWFVLRKFLKLLPIIPHKWNKKFFKEIVGYGINFQAISVAAMFYDPTTKVLLSKFGGLSMVGFYEMGSRMVQQIRALIVSANQVLVPAIADLQEKNPVKVRSVYLTSYQLLFYLALPVFSLIILSSPIISELWIGAYEKSFVFVATFLAIGWFLNVLSAPAYFINLGTGDLRWNVVAHIAIGIINIGLCLILGTFFGGYGVVIAWVISLAFGSSIIYLSYHIKHKISFIELLPRQSIAIIIGCAISIIIARIIPYQFNSLLNPVIQNSITIAVFVVIVFIPMWLHPMRKRLIEWTTSELLTKKSVSQ